jgi:1-deoxy-D-xylulose-5-phosphate reductoisomerase
VEVGERGGTYPAVLCAADEVAVGLFLTHRIGFLDIARLVENTLEQHQGIGNPSLDEILAADAWAGEHAKNWSAR